MADAEDNWWRRGWGIIILPAILLLLHGPTLANAEGHVGCLFVPSLCIDDIEWCFDDFAFGKCLPKYGVDNEETEREPLTEEQSRLMATMLEEMQGAGLGWDHPFVQCRIQGTLFSIRRNTPLPPNLCANLAPDPEILDPQSPLAFVRFTPPNEDYADEVYYPPANKKGMDGRTFGRPPPLNIPPEDAFPPPMPLENRRILTEFSEPDLADMERDRNIQEELARREYIARMRQMQGRARLRQMLAEYENARRNENDEMSNEVAPSNIFLDQLPMKNLDNYKKAKKRTGFENWDEDDENMQENEVPKTSFREVAQNNRLHMNAVKDHFNHYKHSPLSAIIGDEDGLDDNDFMAANTYPMKFFNHKELSAEPSGVYTEGGLVYVPERNSQEAYNKQARDFLADMLGFTRHERLDVKKPGPVVGPAVDEIKKNDTHTGTTGNKESVQTHASGEAVPKAKKLVRDHTDDEHAPHTVDTEYAHVILKNTLDNWRDGARIVSVLAELLNMQNYFTHPRVDRHEVSFRVEMNPEKKTAADVAKAINEPRFKSSLSHRLGVTIVRAGVGDKTKDDTSMASAPRVESAEEGPDVAHIMAYMFAGAGAAAVVVIVITLILIRRHDQKRDKLGGLQAGLSGTESCSKDYQDLCRARMAGKGNTSETISSGRITSLTKENDRPPSSRSSTSSWGEEPALTNMDISTGHMVLSYMEDHLKNKGRLQREWEALCRYEAEPSARDAALEPQCVPLNRVGAPLPYDHSRVVLNHLANAEGLDYINASTITDHDPRAPAYVAAQGPLPTTLAHFWQMIWEQGAVVIVSLCRLQENGEIACARYWPEEGAEVYHIYEVHLVSEHIWCDDYLVRSFYLKNLRTSETRTVTQFHFLTWPQNGIPSSAKALLEFRRKVNKSYRGRSCPIVVHGSNGAGRTGAYILLDLVLGRMNKGAREIDIAATLEHLRDQRAGLVATRAQFEFVLMAVAEEVHAILKALPANSQTEKRDVEKDASKDTEQTQQSESQKAPSSTATPEKSKEKSDGK